MKKFLIIGNMNAVKYKGLFPLIKNNKIWLGNTVPKEFIQPNKKGKAIYSWWFTNLFHNKSNKLILTKSYNEKEYPKYDNYGAIEVSKVADIPKDYEGIMGVPISFMNKYNPEQFEILGITDRQNTSGLRIKKYNKNDSKNYNDLNREGVLKIENKLIAIYTRILIRKRGN